MRDVELPGKFKGHRAKEKLTEKEKIEVALELILSLLAPI